MIWFIVSFCLIGVLSVPGDVVTQASTQAPRERAAALIADLGRTIRIERAFDQIDRLRRESAAELESYAIRFGDALVREEVTLRDLEALHDEFDQKLRAAWERQLAARSALRTEVVAREWRAIFPPPANSEPSIK